MNYWAHKDENKAKAIAHANEMVIKYFDQIAFSANNTIVYPDENAIYKGYNNSCPIITNPNIYIDETDSVSAAFKYNLGRTCILNFASYTNPGGKFIEGSSAQEESLCHESFLYNVLMKHTDFYTTNMNRKNRSLYSNRALYSPCIIFEHNNMVSAFDVITCAAPNFGAASRYHGVNFNDNDLAMESRINFIFDILKDQNIETAILGAYGCGVFKQNPFVVARLFKKAIETGHNTCKNLIFPIPGGNNYYAFKQVFEK